MAVSHDHTARRERLIGECANGPILAFGSAAGGPASDFLYLTGVAEPRAFLLLAEEGIRVEVGARYPGPDYVRGRWARQVLFLPPADPLARRWGEEGGATLDTADPEALGVDAIVPVSEFEATLQRALTENGVLHVVRGSAVSLSGEATPDVRLVARIRERFFDTDLRDATPLVHEARRIKQDTEIEAIRRAAALTEAGLERVRQRIAPGVHERELEAELTACYRSGGAIHAFDPIVGTGANSLKLHYRDNAATLGKGQLVLVDTGASLDGYASDVTRTYPVDGRFTQRQREVYEVVLAAQREAIAICRRGALLADVHATAFRVIEQAGLGEFFVHGTSHHIGLETHDVGDVHRPLEPG